MGPLSAWTGTEMTEFTLEKELVGEGITANHLFSYTSRVSGHRLQEKVEMAFFFIPCFSVFTYPLKISCNVFWSSSFSSLSSSQIFPSPLWLERMETGSGWGWKEKKKRTLLCRKVLPRSGMEPKGKLTGIKAANQRPWQCPSVIPFWASKSYTGHFERHQITPPPPPTALPGPDPWDSHCEQWFQTTFNCKLFHSPL